MSSLLISVVSILVVVGSECAKAPKSRLGLSHGRRVYHPQEIRYFQRAFDSRGSDSVYVPPPVQRRLFNQRYDEADEVDPSTPILRSNPDDDLKDRDIKNYVNQGNYVVFTNAGGTYGVLSNTVSKKGLIEADHFPPKATYKAAINKNIRELDPNQMAAVSIDYAYHRPLITTGNHANNPEMDVIKGFMRDGKFYDAIRANLLYYKNDPRRQKYTDKSSDNRRTAYCNILEPNKSGIRAALKVHVQNGLLNSDERNELINEFQLRDDAYAAFFESRVDRQEAIDKINANSLRNLEQN